jgi:hypothetical protein
LRIFFNTGTADLEIIHSNKEKSARSGLTISLINVPPIDQTKHNTPRTGVMQDV